MLPENSDGRPHNFLALIFSIDYPIGATPWFVALINWYNVMHKNMKFFFFLLFYKLTILILWKSLCILYWDWLMLWREKVTIGFVILSVICDLCIGLLTLTYTNGWDRRMIDIPASSFIILENRSLQLYSYGCILNIEFMRMNRSFITKKFNIVEYKKKKLLPLCGDFTFFFYIKKKEK